MPDSTKKPDNLSARLDRLCAGGERGRKREFAPDEIRKAVHRSLPHRPGSVVPARESVARRTGPSPAMTPILYRRDLPCAERRPWRPSRRPAGPRVVLENVTAGSEIRHGPLTGFVVTTRLDGLNGDIDPAMAARFRTLIGTGDSALRTHIASVCDPTGISHDNVIFVDVESTGLTSSPLFLIGVMTWADDGFETRQFFARDYAEETTVIRLFLEACAGRKLLVTFNGKTFDLPYIRTRAAATGVPFTIPPHHLDMLHVCRRAWRRRLPNCRLQTLETMICNRARHGDIPGSEIPDAYHEYVRTGDAWQMVDVLKHNMLDLATMADLMNRLPAAQM